MVDAGIGTKIILFYLMIDCFLWMGGYVDTTNNWMFESFVDVSGNSPLNNTTVSYDDNVTVFTGLGGNTTGGGITGGLLDSSSVWLNTIGAFMNALYAIFKFFFAPVYVLQRIPNMPAGILLIVGVVPLVALILAFLQAVGGRTF